MAAARDNGVTVEASVLAKAMRGAAGIVESRATIPILSHVRLIAGQGDDGGDWLEVTTSDLDIEYRQRVPLAAPGALATTVSAARLKDIAAAVMPGAQLALSLENEHGGGERLVCKAGRSRWVLPVLAASDFPALPADGLCEPVELGAKALAAQIARVAWAAAVPADAPGRPYLCAVFLNREGGKTRLTATDTKVMVAVEIDMVMPEGAPDAIVPTKLIKAIQREAGEAEDGAVTLSWSDRLLRMTAGAVTLTGKLIEPPYVDYRRFLPSDAGTAVLLQPEVMRAALRRVKLVADDKARNVRFERGGEGVTLSLVSFEHGAATELVEAECDELPVTAFRTGHLDALLEAIGGDTVEIFQPHPEKPALVRRKVSDGSFGMIGAVSV